MERKQKNETLTAKLGFGDPDLKDECHDEILLWLDREMPRLISALVGGRRTWAPALIAEQRQAHPDMGEPPSCPVGDVLQIDWEKPIATKTDYVVGFADMAVQYIWCPNLETLYDCKNHRHEWWINERPGTIYFEAKTTIPSIGELLRQINLYRQYVRGHFVVVCPDNRATVILNQQGVGFLLYAPDEKPTIQF